MQAVPLIRTRKPDIQRIRVVAIDAQNGKSRSTTVYGMTPEQFISTLESLDSPTQGQQQPAEAAAMS